MRIIILGGDGYLGWPTAISLSNAGHDVMVVDNYLRRNVCAEQDVSVLFPAPNLHERARAWRGESGRSIEVRIGDICDYPFLISCFQAFHPDTVVHYAEQPSAPYSMLGQREAQVTLQNNLTGTLNVAYAVYETNPDIHLIKLGTMGEYGTPPIDIEEGFIDIEHKGRSGRFLFPRQAGSLYHTTKIQDTDLLYFYVRTWGLRVTDLMQGPVYGLFIPEMGENEALYTMFNYDEIFGTVLNRFMVQAVASIPLTVYGKGGQTRGYLNIIDTMQCIRLAVENPVPAGELRVFNQFTETFSVNDLAARVQSAGKSMGLEVEINHMENPRVEAEDHYYNPMATGLRELGLEPNLLTEDVLVRIMSQIALYQNAIRPDIVQPKTQWKRTQ
jgi:UDP-sulfoquinovose synthase